MLDIVAIDKSTQMREITTQAYDYVSNSKADSTLRAYREDWSDFAAWCASFGFDSLPATPNTVAAYITNLLNTPVVSKGGRVLSDRHSISTVERRLASISKKHKLGGFPNPASRRDTVVGEVLNGMKRTHGVKKIRKAAVRVANIHKALDKLPDTLQGKRDAALLLLGYIGALRRSELVALTVEDCTFTQEGMQFTIQRSKTDQEGKGETFGVRFGVNPKTCVVRALREWLDTAGITSGPIFRAINRHGGVAPGPLGSRAVALIMKRLAPQLHLDSALVSGHSLRAGFITDQVVKGTPQQIIMKRSRHKSVSVFNDYFREADIYAVDYGAIAGL